MVEARKLLRRPLRHVDGKGLHEAQRHVHAVGREDELKVPEGARERLGRGAVRELARFDLEGDDGVEVFEAGGGERDGDDGGGLDEVGEADAAGGAGQRAGRRRGVRGPGGEEEEGEGGCCCCCSRRAVRRGDGQGGSSLGRGTRLAQEAQAEGDGDVGGAVEVEGVEGVGPVAGREGGEALGGAHEHGPWDAGAEAGHGELQGPLGHGEEGCLGAGRPRGGSFEGDGVEEGFEVWMMIFF